MFPDNLCIRTKIYVLLIKYSGIIYLHLRGLGKISISQSRNFCDDETQATVEIAAAKLYLRDTEFDCQSRLVNSNFSKTRSCTSTSVLEQLLGAIHPL